MNTFKIGDYVIFGTPERVCKIVADRERGLITSDGRLLATAPNDYVIEQGVMQGEYGFYPHLSVTKDLILPAVDEDRKDYKFRDKPLS